MSTASSTITHNLPEFPYSPASDARTRLGPLLSSSHFVTTVVSPPPLAPPPPSATPRHGAADQEDSTDRRPDPSSAEITAHQSPPPACTGIPSLLIEPAQSQSFNRRSPPRAVTTRSVAIQTVRFKTSKHWVSPSQVPSFTQSLVPIVTGQECITRPAPRRRSAWRRFKRMGNHFITPLRSMGLGFTACIGGRRAVAFCEDFSAHDTSPGSSWYSSGEYPPEFIRAVLENNVLLGKVTVE